MLTVEELIKNKEEILKESEKQEIKKEKLHIKNLNGEIEITSTDEDFVRECIDKSNKEISADARLVYYCISNPNLKDERLLKAYDCSDNPLKVVEKIFKKKETVQAISSEIIRISGVDLSSGVTRVIENVKN